MRTVTLDNSTLKATASCSTLAALRYHLGLVPPEARAPLEAGTAVHAALAQHFSGRAKDVALDALDESYKGWAMQHVSPLDRLSYDNVRAIVSYWIDSHPLASFPFTVPAGMVEVGAQALLTAEGQCLCEHPLHDGRCPTCTCADGMAVIFAGRLDAAVRGRDHQWYALDTKTTYRIDAPWLAQFELDSQMTGYVWLLQQHLKEPVAGALINGIQLVRIPASEKKCPKHGTAYAECGLIHTQPEDREALVRTVRTPEQVAEWRRTALHLARRYVALTGLVQSVPDLHRVRQQGLFTGRCQFCDYRRFCVSGRDPVMASGYLHVPWHPFEPVAVKV